MKYLLWILVGGLAWWWWRRHHLAPSAKSAPPSPAEPVQMVHCVSCGVHLPLTDASWDAEGHYHCAEHRPPSA